MRAAGYSGTPLARKLGIVEGCCIVTRYAPDDYEQLLQPIPRGVTFGTTITGTTHMVHLFTVSKAVLRAELADLRAAIEPDGVVWVSWPKKASKFPTDVTEDTIREVCLPLGFVDVKVCAVNDRWSGLKLVIRKELR